MIMAADKGQSRFINFFRDEYDRLVGYTRRLIDDTAERDGEDIVQEVMTSVFNVADVTIPIENLAAYLYQSLRNRVVDYLRKRRPEMMSLDEELFDGSDLSLSDLVPDPAGDALDEFEKQETLHHLFAAIELLSEDEKAVIFETEFEGRSFKELSEKWDIPLGTLLARKSRALGKVRQMLVDFNI
jgi:RNA polymerase sigma factor (sigma-70 family)